MRMLIRINTKTRGLRPNESQMKSCENRCDGVNSPAGPVHGKLGH